MIRLRELYETFFAKCDVVVAVCIDVLKLFVVSLRFTCYLNHHKSCSSWLAHTHIHVYIDTQTRPIQYNDAAYTIHVHMDGDVPFCCKRLTQCSTHEMLQRHTIRHWMCTLYDVNESKWNVSQRITSGISYIFRWKYRKCMRLFPSILKLVKGKRVSWDRFEHCSASVDKLVVMNFSKKIEKKPLMTSFPIENSSQKVYYFIFWWWSLHSIIRTFQFSAAWKHVYVCVSLAVALITSNIFVE